MNAEQRTVPPDARGARPRNAAGQAAAVPQTSMSPSHRFLKRFRRHKPAVASLVFLAIACVVALAAGLLAPHDPLAQDLTRVLQPPSSANWLGTDELGRDVLSRLLHGAQISMLAAVQATAIALVLGVPPGLAAGFFGRRFDTVIMALTDVVMSFPALILAISITAVMGPGLTNAMLAVGVIVSPRVVRLVRSAVMQVVQETYIEASVSIGTPRHRVIRQHVLPNIMAPLIVFSSILAGQAMLIEAGLSFIGLGVQPPQASWGAMLGSAFRHIARAPTLILFPGFAIALTVLALNTLGDGIRDSIGRESRRTK
ncbi:ABC transporter permease [Streptomyces sp. NPDC057580]|uniref:ABC transporter permease n=1 Tax=Streptomyces sp. NPDC057580 TaxID=3346173 RepID=UPI0036C83096